MRYFAFIAVIMLFISSCGSGAGKDRLYDGDGNYYYRDHPRRYHDGKRHHEHDEHHERHEHHGHQHHKEHHH